MVLFTLPNTMKLVIFGLLIKIVFLQMANTLTNSDMHIYAGPNILSAF